MKKKTMYVTCENCGSNLDYGESCDCKKTEVAKDKT